MDELDSVTSDYISDQHSVSQINVKVHDAGLERTKAKRPTPDNNKNDQENGAEEILVHHTSHRQTMKQTNYADTCTKLLLCTAYLSFLINT